MTAAEIAAAKDAIKRLVLPLDEVKTRRLAPHPRGHLIDMRRTLRASLKAGGAVIDLKYLGPKTKAPPLVALLDISGSMSQYTRLFLHFLHARHRCAQARPHLPVRHAAHQRHPRAQGARSGRRAGRLLGERAGLVGRHAHRLLAARLQQAVGAPRAHPGRDRAPHHRWARARRRRHARLRDRPAAPLLPAADLAQSAAALRGLRGAGRAASRPCCRMSTNSGRSTIWNPWRSWCAR